MRNKNPFKIKKIDENLLNKHSKKIVLSLSLIAIFTFAGLNNASAAPSNTPPNSNVTPNFEGINVKSGGVSISNQYSQEVIRIDSDLGTDYLGGISFFDKNGVPSLKIDGENGRIDAKIGLFETIDITNGLNIIGVDPVNMITQGINSVTNKAEIILKSSDGDVIKLDAATGTVTAKKLISEALELGTDLVAKKQILKDTSGKTRIELNADNGRIIMWDPDNQFLAPFEMYAISGDSQLRLRKSDYTTTFGVNGRTGDVSATGKIEANNITATNGIGKFYSKNSGWLSYTVTSGSSETSTIYCDTGDQMTGCQGYLWPSIVGIQYMGGIPYGSNGCGNVFYNTTAASQSIWVQNTIYCFDPSTN